MIPRKFNFQGRGYVFIPRPDFFFKPSKNRIIYFSDMTNQHFFFKFYQIFLVENCKVRLFICTHNFFPIQFSNRNLNTKNPIPLFNIYNRSLTKLKSFLFKVLWLFSLDVLWINWNKCMTHIFLRCFIYLYFVSGHKCNFFYQTDPYSYLHLKGA